MTQDSPFSWRFVTPLFVGSTLNPVNSSLIATALVPIAAGIHVSVGQTTALISALYLATAIGQPTAGKLSQEFGPRRIFLAGILAVLTGGIVGALGGDLTTLIVARVLIGIGTATAYPSAMLLVRRRADQAGMAEPPGGVLGGLVITGTVTAALGLPIGGVLVNAWGWRTTFLVNIPFALVALAMALAWIPADARAERRTPRDIAAAIDLTGIAAFAGTLVALLVFLLSLPRLDWVALGLAVVIAAVLVWWELRVDGPFFDVRLLATNLALTRTYLRYAVTTLCIYTVLYGVTQWLEAGRGLSSQETGLLLLPMSAIGAALAQPLSRRNLVRLPLLLAAGSCVVGSLGVVFLGAATPIVWIVIVTLVFGITLGTTASGNQTTLYAQADAAQIGTASGLLRSFGYIGSIASSAIISVAFHSRIDDPGLHRIGWIMVAVSVVGLLLLLTDRHILSQVRSRSRSTTTESKGMRQP
ncbi:MAG TPA: MFS transporter [Pseudonocardiaceae bacterium]|nr:MFS transporter [Pseudonocardiaceae bacterium]